MSDACCIFESNKSLRLFRILLVPSTVMDSRGEVQNVRNGAKCPEGLLWARIWNTYWIEDRNMQILGVTEIGCKVLGVTELRSREFPTVTCGDVMPSIGLCALPW